jgi:hypothetical protein
VDEPTSVRKFRVVPRPSYFPFDRLPARFRAGRSGWPKTQFQSIMRLFGMSGVITADRRPQTQTPDLTDHRSPQPPWQLAVGSWQELGTWQLAYCLLLIVHHTVYYVLHVTRPTEGLRPPGAGAKRQVAPSHPHPPHTPTPPLPPPPPPRPSPVPPNPHACTMHYVHVHAHASHVTCTCT